MINQTDLERLYREATIAGEPDFVRYVRKDGMVLFLNEADQVTGFITEQGFANLAEMLGLRGRR